MPTDLYQVGPTYYSNTTTVDYTGSYQTTSGVPTVTVIDLGPGYPGDPSNYVGPDGEIGPWYENPAPSSEYTGETRYTGGWDSYNPEYTNPGGGSVTQPIVVDDGITYTLPISLDVVIREGIRVTGGESFTSTATFRLIEDIDTGSGTSIEWTNEFSLVNGGEAASVVLGPDEVSNFLQFSIFDVDIPPGATITGLTMTVERTILSGSATDSASIYRCAFQ